MNKLCLNQNLSEAATQKEDFCFVYFWVADRFYCIMYSDDHNAVLHRASQFIHLNIMSQNKDHTQTRTRNVMVIKTT